MRSYYVGKFFIGMQALSTATTAQRNAPFSAIWSTRANNNFFTFASSVLSRFCFQLDSNANTVNGAEMSLRLANVNTTLLIVVDQADGFFVDDTNQVATLENIEYNYFYLQGDSSVVTNMIGNLVELT